MRKSKPGASFVFLALLISLASRTDALLLKDVALSLFVFAKKYKIK